jgi:tripartite-type tricarboxylate transporter receptor subunit TctC
LPDVPTYAELGMPECNGMAWYGLVYPAKTPDAIVQRVHAAAVRSLADPAVRDKLRDQAAFAVGNTPAQFAEEIRKEIETNRRVVKEQGIVMTE